MRLKKYTSPVLISFPLMAASFLHKEIKFKNAEEDGWVGMITYSYIMKDQGEREEGEYKSEWNYSRKAHIMISVKGVNKKEKNTDAWNKEKNIGFAYMTDKLENWQRQTTPFVKEVKNIQIITENEIGSGEGEVEVWVEMSPDNKTYWLKTNGPMYFVRRKSRVWSNIIEMGGGQQPVDTSSGTRDGIAIDVPDQHIGSNPKVLTGSYIVLSTPTIKVVVTWNLRKPCPPWNNPLTQKNINTLDPKVKAAAERFVKRVNDELCIRLKVASAYRTNDEQDGLYAIGRDKNGKKIGKTVTNARGGQSNHNFGRAIDVYYATDTGIDVDKVLSPEIVEIARQEGFDWGGYWSDPDYPHFEMKF